MDPYHIVIWEFLKTHYNIIISILAAILTGVFIALMVLSLLEPEIISMLFSPALNIFQIQILSGAGISIGVFLGFKKLNDYCSASDENESNDDNMSRHDSISHETYNI